MIKELEASRQKARDELTRKMDEMREMIEYEKGQVCEERRKLFLENESLKAQLSIFE